MLINLQYIRHDWEKDWETTWHILLLTMSVKANMIKAFHLMLTPLQVLKKESQEFVPRSYWDMLRRGASQALFSDLAEVQP